MRSSIRERGGADVTTGHLELEPPARRVWLPSFGRRLPRPLALAAGTGLLTLIILGAVIVPVVNHGAVYAIGRPLKPPSASHLFGTDEVGRDIFARAMAGARLDLGIAVAGVAASLLIGTLVGILAGLSRRAWLDGALMRVVDAFIAFPFLVLVLLIVVLLGPGRSFWFLPAGVPATVIALVATDWAWYARLGRGQTLALRERDYVVASRLLGFSTLTIIRRELAPAVIRVNAAYAVGDAILFVAATASLSFLGAGVQAPTPEWGAMMLEGQPYLQVAWWITLLPGALLALTGVGFSLIADGLLGGSDARA